MRQVFKSLWQGKPFTEIRQTIDENFKNVNSLETAYEGFFFQFTTCNFRNLPEDKTIYKIAKGC